MCEKENDRERDGEREKKGERDQRERSKNGVVELRKQVSNNQLR